MAHKLNIVLAYTEPKIYRKVIVPERFTFDQLHYVIQIVMGWDDYHLYQFNVGAPYNSVSIQQPDEEGEEDDFGMFGRRFDRLDSTTTFLGDILTPAKKKINYIYDFGDDWIHQITLLSKPKEEVLFPVCIEGDGAAPVEDCGGIPRFYEMLETLASLKNSPEKKELKEWLGLRKGQTYESVYGFHIDEINEALKSFSQD